MMLKSKHFINKNTCFSSIKGDNLPVNPGTHIQEKVLSPDIHVPPFLHAGGSSFTISDDSQYDVRNSQFLPEIMKRNKQ